MKKNIPILIIATLSCLNTFCQNLSLANAHLLIFSKSVDESNKILKQSGFEFNKIITSQDRGRDYKESSFLKQTNDNKGKSEEIVIFRQMDSVRIEKLEYSTDNFETYSSYKKDAESTLKKLGESKDIKCKMISYRGDTLLQTFEDCTVNGVKTYKIIVFNLLAAPH